MNPAKSVAGLRTSARPVGALAQQWLDALDAMDAKLRPRIARGRTLARGGRVKELEVAPGAAYGVVKDAEPQRPTLRIRTFEEPEWTRVVDVLRGRLDLLGQLLEGKLDDALLAVLADQDVPLLPRPGEVDGDCDCGDWAVPCPHVAALHHVVGEALEGEPFHLFTMRGRTRDQLLNDLRRAWGDVGVRAAPAEPDEPLDGDVFTAPQRAAPSFRFDGAAATMPGMVELGPLAGDDDLLRALTPLYDAAAAHALEVALGESAAPARPARRRPTASGAAKPAPTPPAAVPPAPPAGPRGARVTPDGVDLGERLVELLGELGETTPEALSQAVSVPEKVVRLELAALSKLGLVYPVDAKRWSLG